MKKFKIILIGLALMTTSNLVFATNLKGNKPKPEPYKNFVKITAKDLKKQYEERKKKNIIKLNKMTPKAYNKFVETAAKDLKKQYEERKKKNIIKLNKITPKAYNKFVETTAKDLKKQYEERKNEVEKNSTIKKITITKNEETKQNPYDKFVDDVAKDLIMQKNNKNNPILYNEGKIKIVSKDEENFETAPGVELEFSEEEKNLIKENLKIADDEVKEVLERINELCINDFLELYFDCGKEISKENLNNNYYNKEIGLHYFVNIKAEKMPREENADENNLVDKYLLKININDKFKGLNFDLEPRLILSNVKLTKNNQEEIEKLLNNNIGNLKEKNTIMEEIEKQIAKEIKLLNLKANNERNEMEERFVNRIEGDNGSIRRFPIEINGYKRTINSINEKLKNAQNLDEKEREKLEKDKNQLFECIKGHKKAIEVSEKNKEDYENSIKNCSQETFNLKKTPVEIKIAVDGKPVVLKLNVCYKYSGIFLENFDAYIPTAEQKENPNNKFVNNIENEIAPEEEKENEIAPEEEKENEIAPEEEKENEIKPEEKENEVKPEKKVNEKLINDAATKLVKMMFLQS